MLCAAFLMAIAGCRRSRSETGDVDRISPECMAAEWPPAEGGLETQSSAPATLSSPQTSAWQTVSTDPECASLAPPSVPARLSWDGPRTKNLPGWCDPPIIDGEGNMSVAFLSETGNGTMFFRPDGSGAVVKGGAKEYKRALSASAGGFLLLTHTQGEPRCEFLRSFRADATPQSSIPVASDPDSVNAVVRNPLGGFVEERTKDENNGTEDFKSSLQVRWLNDALEPIGNWQTVLTVNGLRQNHYRRVVVDQRGKALVLSFIYPPSFGPPAPPSQWRFSARWMGPEGPISEPFEPISPAYTSADGATVLFANWGAIVPLRDGGLAMFQPPAPAWTGGTISPVGWYAFYPSGQRPGRTIPDWVKLYDGSLQLLSDGSAYAAVRQSPDSCRRTLLLIAPSGRTCYSLRVEAEEQLCDWSDSISPEGTLVLQNLCQLRWWPGVARFLR
jgi:hypothetical protein